MFWDKLFGKKKPNVLPKEPVEDDIEQLKKLVNKAIDYEDHFIETYFEFLKTEEFAQYFEDNKEEATKLIEQLIRESKGHKIALQNIINKF